MKKLLFVGLTTLGFMIPSASALAMGDCLPGQSSLFCKNPAPSNGSPTSVSAPEIDVGAGAKGIGLLVIGVLLAAEGLRRRRKR